MRLRSLAGEILHGPCSICELLALSLAHLVIDEVAGLLAVDLLADPDAPVGVAVDPNGSVAMRAVDVIEASGLDVVFDCLLMGVTESQSEPPPGGAPTSPRGGRIDGAARRPLHRTSLPEFFDPGSPRIPPDRNVPRP